ncbi:hypothetical protein IYX23_13005 [Methylocystis sp. L43]|jgi:hypothetical protein|uniref:hypothetical protein n=1 Tax=unclassified Methylocystis TaxID=2625913 RepID=UPI0018C2A949|nr:MULTISPECIES: hypothetical protein [unclassified Methylocystis]MBG0798590.1 hypothetical protein [Methylocystis sp. L43]MBG0806905.1 hypothetical protein [Methylocystis sp. H15]
MATNTQGERALADLEAGKFSFPMVDSIRDHVNQLDAELQRVRTELQRVNSLHEGAVNQLRQQEFTILRLEGELRKLNARLYALLKANVLTEAALRETKRGAAKFVELLPVARKHAEEGSKAALAYLSTIDLQAKVEAVKTHPLTEKTLAWLANLDLRAEWTKLKTHPLTTKAVSELQSALLKAKENLPVVQKRIAALVEKASAYIAELQKKAA